MSKQFYREKDTKNGDQFLSTACKLNDIEAIEYQIARSFTKQNISEAVKYMKMLYTIKNFLENSYCEKLMDVQNEFPTKYRW